MSGVFHATWALSAESWCVGRKQRQLTDCLLGLGPGGLATWRNMLGFGHTPRHNLLLPAAVSGSEVEVDGSYPRAPAALGSVRLASPALQFLKSFLLRKIFHSQIPNYHVRFVRQA